MSKDGAIILREIRELLQGPELVTRKVRAMVYLNDLKPKRYQIHKWKERGQVTYGLVDMHIKKDADKIIDFIHMAKGSCLFPGRIVYTD